MLRWMGKCTEKAGGNAYKYTEANGRENESNRKRGRRVSEWGSKRVRERRIFALESGALKTNERTKMFSAFFRELFKVLFLFLQFLSLSNILIFLFGLYLPWTKCGVSNIWWWWYCESLSFFFSFYFSLFSLSLSLSSWNSMNLRWFKPWPDTSGLQIKF